MTELTIEAIRKVIREETKVMRKDIVEIKKEQSKQGVLMEDMDGRLKTALENLSKNLTVKKQVDKHEERLTEIEATQKMLPLPSSFTRSN